MAYSDNTQVYLSFEPNERATKTKENNFHLLNFISATIWFRKSFLSIQKINKPATLMMINV